MRRPWTEAARNAALTAAVAVLAILTFLNAVGGDFTFDDSGLIRDNPMINRDPPLRLFIKAFYPGALYRPVTMLTYVANARWWPTPAGFHVVNVVLHTFATLAVLRLSRTLTQSTTAAVSAAALFAVHPIHTEAVTSIVGRAELLAALGVLGALLAFVRALDGPVGRRGLWYSLSVVAFGTGVLAKESAFTGVALVPVVHRWLRPDERWRRAVGIVLPYAAVGLAYLALRIVVLGSLALPEPPSHLDNPLAHVSLLPRWQTALVVLWEYLSQLTVPLYLSADYSFNEIPLVTSARDPRFLIASSVLAACLFFVALAVRRVPGLLLAALLGVIPLTLTANILVPIGTIKAERLLYLPSFGWCLACGVVIAHIRSRYAVVVLAGAVACYAARTAIRNRDWRDNLTLFQATVQTAPESAKAHYNLGVAYVRAGRLDDSMLHFRAALAIDPEYAAPAFGIGHVYDLKGRDAGALHWYEKAMRTNWSFAKAHLNTGVIRHRFHEYDAAEAAFRTGLESDPDDVHLLINLSLTRLAQGDWWGACALLERAAALNGHEPEVAAIITVVQQGMDRMAQP